MKNVVITCIRIVLLALALLVLSPSGITQAQPGVSVSFSLFYNSLSPYGYWVDDPAYGYVWVPDVGVSFRPYYSGGHWVMTSYGNMWVSDYPWGWAPFHYGRWIYDGYYGWLWVPGQAWGPAWVSWRWGGGYCGWAPLGPGVSLSVAFNSYAPPADWWVFIEPTYIYSPVFYRYYEGASVNVTYLRRTSFVSNTYVQNGTTYVAGPSAAEIGRATNQRIAVYDVKEGKMPSRAGISGNDVRVYRPEIKSSGGKSVAPARFTKAEQPIGKMSPLGANGGKPGRLNGSGAGKMNENGTAERKSDPAKPARRSEEKISAPDNSRSKREEYERRQPERKQAPAPEKNDRQKPAPEKKPQAAPQPEQRKPDTRSSNKEKMHAAPPREMQGPAAQPPREQKMPSSPQPKRGSNPKNSAYPYPSPAKQPMEQPGGKSQAPQPKEHGGKK